MTAGLDSGLGLIILALALVASVGIVVYLRREQRKTPNLDSVSAPFIPSSSSQLNEAILIVQAGGRVEYINDLAREWFDLRPDEAPDLERLFRRVRPAEEFIDLCARQGQKRISISGQLVEANSYQVPGPDLLMLIAMRSVELSKNLIATSTDSSILQL